MTTSPATTDPWTTKRLLRWMMDRFTQSGLDHPRITAELLLAHVLECERIRLYMDVDREASEDERERLRDLVRRALKHEPVQYLTGVAPFFTLEFDVSPVTLIPRPSTESLVDAALRDLRARESAESRRLLDIGTGTGCIAISLLRHVPTLHAVVTDLDEDVLALARTNAERLGVIDRMEFRIGSLFAPVADEQFDVIVSNPPYISDAEWVEVEPNVRDHEPERALRAGGDGLDIIRPLIEQASSHLLPNGSLFIEFGHAQHDAVRALVEHTPGLRAPTTLKDHEEFWRIIQTGRSG
jgi:release factor glutamine methyltransferase